MNKIEKAQSYLQEMQADGWLIYDFHGVNDLALRFLEIAAPASRRIFYWIPQKGEPIRLVHAIEPHVLDQWPGEKRVFHSWTALQQELGRILKGAKKIAMEYSQSIPYVSKVDAGTVDLVRSFGVEVISSGAFLPHFTAVLNDAQKESHFRAGKALDLIVSDAWRWISDCLKQKKSITDYDVQQKILQDFKTAKLKTDEPPIVAINKNSADPHYAPSKKHPVPIRLGDFILIDMWAREDHPHSVFGDITRVGVVAAEPTKRQHEIFSIVRKAQKAARELVQKRFEQKKRICGFEVDDCARGVIRDAGYEKYFIHRTGHSIDTSLHGSGANMDNLEMHDDRPILPSTAFSIEPGIYLPEEFGVRLEYDLYVHLDGRVEIVGGEQDSIVLIERL